MAEAAPLAFNVSVPSDGLQGRTRPEKTLHKFRLYFRHRK
jgi:hypothetical protein